MRAGRRGARLSSTPPSIVHAAESGVPPNALNTLAGGARVTIEGAPDAKILASGIGALSKAER
jgi:transposase